MQSCACVYSRESSCSAFIEHLTQGTVELMCVMVIQIVNTGIISSRWDPHAAFAEESVGMSPQCSRPHNKGRRISQDSYN